MHYRHAAALALALAAAAPAAQALLLDPHAALLQSAREQRVSFASVPVDTVSFAHNNDIDVSSSLAPHYTAAAVTGNTVDAAAAAEARNSYIVVVKPEHFEAHMATLSSLLVAPMAAGAHVAVDAFDMPGMRGYTLAIRPEQEREADISVLSESILASIRASGDILFVEDNQVVSVSYPTAAGEAAAKEKEAPWGLARISSHTPVESDNLSGTYTYYESDGEDVTAYVVDTGVNVEHEDFEGRAIWGATIPQNDFDVDGNGHGTHVAGTIAGTKYGVAKKANVVAVKVLRSSGSGTMADVVRGIEWVYKKHKTNVAEAEMKALKEKKPAKKVRAVANMSLGGGKSFALNLAVNAAVDSGVHFVVAAGNENQDACNVSPSSAEKAFTVGATTIDDERAWFSNFGKCLDIFAPGHQILSTWIGSKNATNSISGTSMASPHVAGVFTALLSRPEYAELSVDELRKVVTKVAGKDQVSKIPEVPESPNLMLYSIPPGQDDKAIIKAALS